MSIITLGLDLSLTSSGVTVIKDRVIIYTETVKSSRCGDLPIDELSRLLSIVKSIENLTIEYKPALAVIEGLAFAARNTTALVQLSGLNYLTRTMLFNLGVPFAICATTSLKKFLTQKGNSPKDHIALEIYKRYGLTILQNDKADSFGLAALGQAVLGKPIKKPTKIEQEVIALIQKQL